METVDDETVAASARDFIDRVSMQAGKPFFVWWNGTRMHFRTHVKEGAARHLRGQDEYADGMVEHDMHVGQLLEKLDELLGIADNTIVFLQHRQRAAHEHLAGRRHDAVPRREEHQLGRRLARPAMVRWPGKIEAGSAVTNEIMHHMDWLPTFLAAAGDPDIPT